MKQLLPLFFLLGACATITAESDQPITVNTQPPGASCTLTNGQGSWRIDSTPGTVSVRRSYSPLRIACTQPDGAPLETQIEAKTRGRAYGNILLLGLPAIVDASTGDGYEYELDSITLP